jgi:hypothetical protein
MLRWARNDRDAFFLRVLPKAVAVADERAEQHEDLADTPHVKELFEKLKLKEETICDGCRQPYQPKCPHCGRAMKLL